VLDPVLEDDGDVALGDRLEENVVPIVRTENLIRVDEVRESLKLAE
jgi:hypothetical protein